MQFAKGQRWEFGNTIHHVLVEAISSTQCKVLQTYQGGSRVGSVIMGPLTHERIITDSVTPDTSTKCEEVWRYLEGQDKPHED